MPKRPPTPRARLAIQDVDCVLLDAVLTLTFDERELENLLGADAGDAEPCPWHGVPSMLDRVHARCHRPGPVARQTQATLDLVHARAVAQLDAVGAAEVWRALAARDLAEVPDLAGWVWALATAPQGNAEALRLVVRRALVVEGLRGLRARAVGA